MTSPVSDVAVVATPDHPFFTRDRVWKPAGQLTTEDYLFDEGNPDGLAIRSITKSQRPVIVYNMEVEGLHNFFVTSIGILTHNVQFNHFFQNAFVKASRGADKTIRYGERGLGLARGMDAVAHKGFHSLFNRYLKDELKILPVRGKPASWFVRNKNLDFEALVTKFRPFFEKKEILEKHPKWIQLFDEEVLALRANKRTVK